MIKLDESQAEVLNLVYEDVTLLTYQIAPKYPVIEFNRPYIHPMRTLAGDVVTNDRPNDHAWHKGLSLTLTVLNNENFWGGRTYVHGQGYVPKDNVGHTLHREWLKRESGDTVTLAHRLDWQTFKGERWLTEERTLTISAHPKIHCWRLEWRSRLENVSGKSIRIGSPTTKGREKAGYGGLFWRGARDLHDGAVISEGGLSGEDEVNGSRGRWVAYSGKHDGSHRQSMVVFCDHPDNPRYPTPWFVRTSQYAGVCPNFAYDKTHSLKPDMPLDLRYTLCIISGVWAREEIEQAVNTLLA